MKPILLQIGRYGFTRTALRKAVLTLLLAGMPIGFSVAASQDGHTLSVVWLLLWMSVVVVPVARWAGRDIRLAKP